MKIAIGDTHGRNDWKEYINEDFEEFYFLGDYFDNYEETPAVSQIRNFNEIVEWARKDPRVKLCLGNHEFHYLRGCESERYSGKQWQGRVDIQIALEAAMDIIQPVYLTDNFLISHAGITKTFLEDKKLLHPLEINKLFKEDRMSLAGAGYDNYGDSIHDGPLWVRPRSLLLDKVDNYKQIVGHTHQEQIKIKDGVIFIDVESKDIYRF